MVTSIAFIGMKGHESVVIEALPQHPELTIAAVADDNPEALRRVPDLPGATAETRAYDDYRELLANHEPDIVVEAGTDRDRAEVVTSCAERGIHVICEKPLAINLEGLEQVQQAVERSGAQLSMLVTMRCDPQYLALREAVRQGLVGDVCQGGGQKSYRLGQRPAWQKSRETFSGIIPFVGIHVMDLFRWATGREYTEVMAYASNAGHPDVGEMEDNACVLARLDNGGTAAFRLDYCRPGAAPTHGDDRLRVAGNLGVVEVQEEVTTLITQEEVPQELDLPEPVPFFADYLDALRERREPFIPFADCVQITEVVLRAREAAESGRPVRLTES